MFIEFGGHLINVNKIRKVTNDDISISYTNGWNIVIYFSDKDYSCENFQNHEYDAYVESYKEIKSILMNSREK